MLKRKSITNCLILLFFSSCLFIAGSCTKDFLNQTKTTDLTDVSVFTDSARTMDFLTQIYTNIDFSFNPARFGGLAGLEAACDESEGPSASIVTAYSEFVSGSVSAFSISTDAWTIPYSNIRAVNQFLKHLPGAPFNNDLRLRAKGEALFLRAWYYAALVKHYGGVPIVGDTVYNVTDKINTIRNTYAECVEYIVTQCDSASLYLPAHYSGSNFGRVTSGACFALKSRVLLYAASPLFNGGGFANAEPLKSIVGYPSNNVERWKRAADAAKAVIDLGLYQLNEDNATSPGYGFYNLFQLRVNNEYIFQKMKDPSSSYHDLELLWRPPSRGGSSSTGASPYQNLVDAFQMKNGLDITDNASGYDTAHPYLNRDPRLDYTVTHNGSVLYIALSLPKPVFTYPGESNGDGLGQGTPTGYYVNKMLNADVVPNWFNTTSRCYPLIRYAEILLNYAEALNEYEGPTKNTFDAVELVRRRAGLSPYTLPANLTQDNMRAVIQHERRVEFAFEEQRFWDVRRWKIAEQTENQVMKGVKINPAASPEAYSYINIRQHSFRTPMYLWPIPQSETAKSATLVQNPGF